MARGSKKPTGRPPKIHARTQKPMYDPETLIELINEYIEEKSGNEEEYPMVSEFLAINKIGRSRFYDIVRQNADLKDTVELLHNIAESKLEKLIIKGKINPVFAIFKLKQKQFGWTDKLDNDTKDTPQININLPKGDK